MQIKKINRITFVWLFILLPIVSAVILRKSFNLGLYGDDWQHLYNLWRDFFVYHRKSFFDIRSYLNPYWPNYLYLGIINHFWGFYAPAYFIASFLMKIFANISLYYLTLGLTKSKLAAVLATVIFLFSAAGLQTTDWVFNMNTYVGLGFLSIATIFYLKIRNLTTFHSRCYIFFVLFFTLALAIVPTRMHGAVSFLILSDLLLTFVVEGRKSINRFLFIRMVTAILIFTTLSYFKSFGEGSFAIDRISESSLILQTFIQKGFHAIWFYFLAILGHLVLPDHISLSNYLTVVLLTSFISITLGVIISFILKTKKITSLLHLFTFNTLYAFILLWIASINPNPIPNLNPYPPESVLFSIALGGQFIFWAIWLFILTKKINPTLSSGLIISLFWIVTLTIIYWTFTPHYIIETTGRYMTMGAAGFAIFFGSFLSLLFHKAFAFQKQEKTRLYGSFLLLLSTFIFFFWIFVNIQKSQDYLGILETTRNRELTDRTWDTLIKTVPKLDPAGPSIFYFISDNPLSLQGVLVFGFFMRSGMTWRIPDQDLTPLPSTDYQELLSYVKDGTPLQKVHGRKAEPVPLSRIYAFDFRNGQLTDITDLARHQLIKDLKIQ